MKKSNLILLIRILIIGVIALLVFIGFSKWQKLQWVDKKIEKVNLTFKLPPDLKEKILNKEDADAKLVFRGESTDLDSYLITIRYEDGLQVVTALTKQEMIPMLIANSGKAFPQRFPEYKQVSSNQIEIDQHKAGEIIFEYKSPTEEIIKQRFLVIKKDENTAIYLAIQSKSNDFNNLNQSIFNKLISSIDIK